jgi:hypothetical protein
MIPASVMPSCYSTFFTSGKATLEKMDFRKRGTKQIRILSNRLLKTYLMMRKKLPEIRTQVLPAWSFSISTAVVCEHGHTFRQKV